jgi:hypothetical protein
MKSDSILFGKYGAYFIEPLLLRGRCIEWVNSIEYLSTHIIGGHEKSFDIQPPKRHFYAARNATMAHAKTYDESLHLTL